MHGRHSRRSEAYHGVGVGRLVTSDNVFLDDGNMTVKRCKIQRTPRAFCLLWTMSWGHGV